VVWKAETESRGQMLRLTARNECF